MVGLGTTQAMAGVLTSSNIHLSVQAQGRGGTLPWLRRKPGQAFLSRKRTESLEKGPKCKKDFSEKRETKEGHFSSQIFDDKEFSRDRQLEKTCNLAFRNKLPGNGRRGWLEMAGREPQRAYHCVYIFLAICSLFRTNNRQMRRVESVEELSSSYTSATVRGVSYTPPHVILRSTILLFSL